MVLVNQLVVAGWVAALPKPYGLCCSPMLVFHPASL